MALTYEPIATTTLSSAQATINFTSIPTTYTDLILVISVNGAGTVGANSRLQVGNGSVDTATNYSETQLYGTGSSASSLRNSNVNYAYGGVVQGGGVAISHFLNYSNTTTYKTILARGSAPANYVDAAVSLWRSTSAINTIKVYADSSGDYPSGSTFTLYGIKAA